MTLILAISPIILLLIYKTLDHFKIIDRLTGRQFAISAYNKLIKTDGYPNAWVLNNNIGRQEFNAILKRAKIHKESTLKTLSGEEKCSLFCVVGNPIGINGLPDFWPQGDKYFFDENFSVVLFFEAQINVTLGEKFMRICTIGELNKIIENEKLKRDFWIITIAIGLISFFAAWLKLLK